MNTNHYKRFSWMVLLLIASGCGKEQPSTVSVQGRVTWQGKPLSHGTITFLPRAAADGKPQRTATGAIATDGTFQMSSYRLYDGVMPGEYYVTIDCSDAPAFEHRRGAPNAAPSQSQSAPPKAFADPNTSGLAAEIPSGPPIVLNFEL